MSMSVDQILAEIKEKAGDKHGNSLRHEIILGAMILCELRLLVDAIIEAEPESAIEAEPVSVEVRVHDDTR